MINSEKLMQSYKELKKRLQNSIKGSNTLDEISQVIFSNQWIKIFLTGTPKTLKIYIQVEISPKDKFQTFDTKVSNFKNEKEKLNFLKEFLSQQIKSLKYLFELTEFGFSLEFLIEENIWLGTKTLEEEPTEEFCKLITPP